MVKVIVDTDSQAVLADRATQTVIAYMRHGIRSRRAGGR